jgi:hypothetical protein
LAKVSRLLYRPLFGTFVVPKDARVDPTLFSEEGFPVFCPRCRYSLRGLRDGLCPECGQPFERGALLVRQYVFEWGQRHRKGTPLARVRRWLVIGATACGLVLLLGVVSLPLCALLWRAGFVPVSVESFIAWGYRISRVLLVLALVTTLLWGTVIVLVLIHCSRFAKKRGAVIAALRAAAKADGHRSSP